jgi:hypothetical protein
MKNLMRCPYCGLLQDEPAGVKTCSRCGGGLDFETRPPSGKGSACLQVQMELDQVAAPAGRNVERHLLITLTTPRKVPKEEAAPPGKPRPPLNFAAVLDISGSMHGEKIAQAREAVRQSVRGLRDGDVFSLVTFASDVSCPYPPAEVNDKFIADVESALSGIGAGGNTSLDGGLEMGIQNAGQRRADNNLVLLLSDGQANVGETDLEKIGLRAYQARQQGLLVSTLGVGLDYNEALMVEVATQGGGRFYHIRDAASIPAFVAGELGEVANLAAREVCIHLSVPEGATLIPLSAAYHVNQADGQAEIQVGDIPCETELEIPLKLALLAQPANAKLSLEGTLTFQTPAAHAVTLPVNRVSVRFMPAQAFQLREGMVLPVAEKVYAQIRASSILGLSRTRAARPAEAEKERQAILGSLNAYVELLGDERAEKEKHLIKEEFDPDLAPSPMQMKMSSAMAFQAQRGSKDFNKKK